MNLFSFEDNIIVKGKSGSRIKTLQTSEKNKGNETSMTREEIETCIDRYGDDIYSFCSYLTGNVNDRDDLFQDTFLLALQKQDKMDPEKNIKSYLLSLTIGIWKNRCRKRKLRSRLTSEPVGEEDRMCQIPDYRANVEEKWIEGEEAEYLRNQVALLPDRYRIPIYLHYLEDMSVNEIASCMHIPEGTVKSRLSTARKKLKERMEVAGYDR